MFYSYKQKRFIRDNVRDTVRIRYTSNDEIQCAAARIVNAIRQKSREHQPINNTKGEFDTFHIRRGDFTTYPVTQTSAEAILNLTRKDLLPGGTIYMATDEGDKSYFDPFQEDYQVLFLDDFKEEVGDLDAYLYGTTMIDQLIAARGRNFFGCFFLVHLLDISIDYED